MSKRPPNKTSKDSIIDYWAARVDECDLSVDWAEADELCWRCGSRKSLIRCHIVPHALKGPDTPSNYVILCNSCHEECPNVSDREVIWDWLMAYKSMFYGSYWQNEGYREYEYIYGRSVEDEIGFLSKQGSIEREAVEREVWESIMQSTTHFGQHVPNKATAAGITRMTLKKLAAECGMQLPDNRRESLTRRRDPLFFQ